MTDDPAGEPISAADLSAPPGAEPTAHAPERGLIGGAVVKAERLDKRRAAIVEAEGVVEAAEAEAAALIAAAERDAERIRAEIAEETRREMASAAAGAAAQHSARMAREIASLEDDLAGLVTRLVRQVVDWAPPEERLAALCARALRDLASERRATLTVAPDQLRRAEAAIGRLAGAGVTLAARDGLGPDDALLETSYGVLNLSLDAQLDAIAQGLAEGLAAARTDGA